MAPAARPSSTSSLVSSSYFLRHPVLVAGVVLWGLAVFLGCRQLDRYNGASGGYCTSDADCQAGLSCLTEADGFPGGYCSRTNCVDGGCPGTFATCAMLDRSNNSTACLEGCNSNSECRSGEGYICADLDGSRGCLPEAQSTGAAGSIGASCARDTDCSGDLTCLTSFVFGYCTRSCSSDAQCGGDSCEDIGGGQMRCMASCTNNSQCRFGYDCLGGACRPVQGGSAVRNPGGAADGDPCTNDIQCAGGTCIGGGDFPGGYCTTRDCDSVGCASDNSTCVATQSGAFCFENCGSSNDCREGYRCTSLETGGSVCYALSPISAPEVDPNGAIPIACDASTVSGNRRQITFQLGAGAVGFTVTPFSPSGSEVTPVSLTMPDGSTLNFDRDYSFQTINSLLLATIVPMLFPAAPQFENLMQSGTYRFTYDTDDAQSCYFVVEQPRLGTRLDVNFYFVGVPNISSANAGNETSFQRMLQEFRTIYQGAGINIGTVRYFDITGENLTRYRIVRSFADIYRLIALSQAPGDSREDALSINVFLIEDFAISDIPGLLGLSAGIPGVPGVHGNGGAGLVFTSANLRADPESLGQTLGHEVGHFLGLRHTSERGGSEYDPLGDTPQCSRPESPFNCSDVENLMFPFSVDGVTQRTVTPNQRFVLQRNPLVK